jgi:phosphoribosylaminoimidazole-succinocarboxamide synthase
VKKTKKIYEGKAKILYQTEDPAYLIQLFKDDATAFDATKRGSIEKKGFCNNKISAAVFKFLKTEGIDNHFVELLNDREMLVKKVEILPIEVTIRNRVAGGMTKMLGIEEGKALKSPILEYHYKSDKLHDPLINEYHIAAMNLASREEISEIRDLSFRINDLLSNYFDKIDLELIDFKLEFGRFQGRIILADEISPDTCRLWDKSTGKKMDKDRFRRDLGQIEETYQEVLRRVLRNR